MDNYFGFRKQAKDHRLKMTFANSHELAILAKRVSTFRLKHTLSRFIFREKNQHRINTCRAASIHEGQRHAFICLEVENNYLRMQYESSQFNKLVNAVYLEVEN